MPSVELPRVKIVSDGTPRGTHLYDATGHEVDGNSIMKIEWSIAGGDGMATVVVTFVSAEVEVLAEMETRVDRSLQEFQERHRDADVPP